MTNQPAGLTPAEAKAWRLARAQKAGKASQNPVAWADRIVKHWPELDDEVRTTVRSTLYRVICPDPEKNP